MLMERAPLRRASRPGDARPALQPAAVQGRSGLTHRLGQAPRSPTWGGAHCSKVSHRVSLGVELASADPSTQLRWKLHLKRELMDWANWRTSRLDHDLVRRRVGPTRTWFYLSDRWCICKLATVWPTRTNIWRKVTSPRTGLERLSDIGLKVSERSKEQAHFSLHRRVRADIDSLCQLAPVSQWLGPSPGTSEEERRYEHH